MRSHNYLFLFSLLIVLGCGVLSAQVPKSQHVWVVTEENHSYEVATASMPYLMSLANQYGLAMQSYSDTHNSISALMHLVAGETVTPHDNTTSYFDVDNIVRHLKLAGLTWRSYQESLPHTGFEGISSYPYVKRHNPLAYFTDTHTTVEELNLIPYPTALLSAASVNYSASNYNYVTPNLLDDAHNGTLPAADAWLSRHIPAILARREFQRGGDGIMFITFDEGGLTSDSRCSQTVLTGCGGHILTVVIGPQVQRSFQSTVWHNHESVLKTVCEALGMSSCPGRAANAVPMSEFFGSAAPHLQITAPLPFSGVVLASPVHFHIKATDAKKVSAIIVYSDSKEVYRTHSNLLDASVKLPSGTHNIVVHAWDVSGALFQEKETITVK